MDSAGYGRHCNQFRVGAYSAGRQGVKAITATVTSDGRNQDDEIKLKNQTADEAAASYMTMKSIQKSVRPVNVKAHRPFQQRTAVQVDFVLFILRQAGAAGISKRDFLTGTGLLEGRMITQVSARVHELEEQGYVIEHRREEHTDFIRFILVAEPSGTLSEAEQMPLGISRAAHPESEFCAHERGVR